ncbi:hypothetical protein ACRRTK_021164 [Alexandromys fortis]
MRLLPQAGAPTPGFPSSARSHGWSFPGRRRGKRAEPKTSNTTKAQKEIHAVEPQSLPPGAHRGGMGGVSDSPRLARALGRQPQLQPSFPDYPFCALQSALAPGHLLRGGGGGDEHRTRKATAASYPWEVDAEQGSSQDRGDHYLPQHEVAKPSRCASGQDALGTCLLLRCSVKRLSHTQPGSQVGNTEWAWLRPLVQVDEKCRRPCMG